MNSIFITKTEKRRLTRDGEVALPVHGDPLPVGPHGRRPSIPGKRGRGRALYAAVQSGVRAGGESLIGGRDADDGRRRVSGGHQSEPGAGVGGSGLTHERAGPRASLVFARGREHQRAIPGDGGVLARPPRAEGLLRQGGVSPHGRGRGSSAPVAGKAHRRVQHHRHVRGPGHQARRVCRRKRTT